MSITLKLLGIFVALILIIVPLIYVGIRKKYRGFKNYERGLKMIPLLIHLPPSSDDVEGGNRDERDVNEETISKAQVIYNIIASTIKKGRASKFYGQRHFTFEIVGYEGMVNYYATVPISLLEVVKQAVISAYPSARLEEVMDHNIFNKVGKLNGVLGGEFVLKESYAYPIATYQDIKRDPMQSILSALSGLDKEDGAAIQLLIRPTDSSWRKTSTKLSSDKRKGGKGGNSKLKEEALWWTKNFLPAIVKPPGDVKSDKKDDKKELSNLEQATLDAIDDKTRHQGFEVIIRVIASSNVNTKAQAIISQLVASFALFDLPGKNGFKYVPSGNIEDLVTSYIMRMFPQEINENILNSIELSTLFHFPEQKNIPTSQLAKQASKQVDGPRNMPEDGLLLGYNVFRGSRKAVRLSNVDRQRHLYSVGQTGTGKSIFLENLALQDMLNGNGFAFVDPHGDTVEDLLAMVPKSRTEDVIYFAPGEMNYPMGLNLFEFDSPDQKDFLIQEAINMLYKLYDPNRQGMMGARFEHLFRMAALTVMADPAGGTLIDIPKLFVDPAYVNQKLKYVTDQTVLDFWRKEMPQSRRSNEFGDLVNWFNSKFGAFLSNEMMRNIIGQTKSSFNIRDIMDNKKILLVNLSKGVTGELNSRLLGMIFVMKFQAAAMSRVDIPESDRKDFCLYVDEFQNFSTDSLAVIMSEARKFRLNLIVANQFTTQLSQEIRDAVFGNIGTIVSFRIGQNDVESIGKYFQPVFDSEDLLRVPNFNTIVRTLINGVPTQPFTMATLPQLGEPNRNLSDALKQLSAAKYGRPRAMVDKEINERLHTPTAPAVGEPSSPSSTIDGARMNAPAATGSTNTWTQDNYQRPKPAVKPGASFIDDWLAKKRAKNIQHAQYKEPMPIKPQGNVVAPGQPQLGSINNHTQAPSVVPSGENTTIVSSNPDLNTKPEVTNADIKAVNDQINNTQSLGIQHSKLENGDTIFIDNDGNLTYKINQN